MEEYEVNIKNPLSAPYQTGEYLISDIGAASNFRSAMSLEENPYRASGSHQLSLVDFASVFRSEIVLPYHPKAIHLIDLREESHGYFAGEPVSWYADNDFSNVGKSTELILAEEEARLKAYEGHKTRLYTITDDAGDDLGQERVVPASYAEIKATSVRTEAEVASQLAEILSIPVKYTRIPVTDHSAPSDDALHALSGVMPFPGWDDPWLHFHCHGGDGRTTTFLAAYDMWRTSRMRYYHASDQDERFPAFEDFIRRQCQLFPYDLDPAGGNCGPAVTGWKLPLAQARWDALQKYYDVVGPRVPASRANIA